MAKRIVIEVWILPVLVFVHFLFNVFMVFVSKIINDSDLTLL